MLAAGRFLNQFLTLPCNDRENILMQTSSSSTSKDQENPQDFGCVFQQ
jgi:hypothetical protein